jgi:hydrogenase expression/formation protein HypC
MCLAVPGKIIAIAADGESLDRTGTVDFQGNRVDTSLVMTPDVRVGDWVLVHAGFAIEVLDEADARETWRYLEACLPEGDVP